MLSRIHHEGRWDSSSRRYCSTCHEQEQGSAFISAIGSHRPKACSSACTSATRRSSNHGDISSIGMDFLHQVNEFSHLGITILLSPSPKGPVAPLTIPPTQFEIITVTSGTSMEREEPVSVGDPPLQASLAIDKVERIRGERLGPLTKSPNQFIHQLTTRRGPKHTPEMFFLGNQVKLRLQHSG
jgi:hypothetical protein